MKFSTTVYCIALAIAATNFAEAHTLEPVNPLVCVSKTHQPLRNIRQDVDLVALVDEQLAVRGGAGSSALVQSLKVVFYFALWYALNVIYNSTYCLSAPSA